MASIKLLASSGARELRPSPRRLHTENESCEVPTAVRHPGPLVGRDDALAFIAGCVEARERLISIFGPPGVGKTRLAIEALRSAETAGMEVRFCDMRGVADLDSASDIVLPALAEPDASRQSPRRLLVVLDEFDALVKLAGEAIEQWAAGCLDISFLVTSRETLHVPGEISYELLPLALPSSKETLEDSPAGLLLMTSVQRVRFRVPFTDEERQGLFEIATRLEGFPFVIERLAPAIGMVGVATVYRRMDSVFASSAEAEGGFSEATSPLRSCIARTFRSLDDDERRALLACTVFRGGFTIEAMEAVIEPQLASRTLPLLCALRGKSLARAVTPSNDPSPRFSLYAMAASVAVELGRAEWRALAAERHRDYFATRAQALLGHRSSDTRAAIHADAENLAVALEGTRTSSAPVSAAQPKELHLAKAANASALLAHVDGDWFRPPRGSVVKCFRRDVLRIILRALVQRRQQQPGAPLSIWELDTLCWPSESLDEQRLLGRVRQSMAVLRRLGLGKLLLWANGGYLLDPTVPIEIQS